MNRIKLFLASSSELKADREQFEIFIYRRCKRWFERGIFLHLDIWEDFLDAMAPDGLQSAYNQVVKDCDIFVLLVHNKVGKYTAEEFGKAFGQFSETQKPFIFTYFKTPHTTRGRDDLKSLWAFEDTLNTLNHYRTEYRNIEGLREHFGNQLDKLVDSDFLQLSPTSWSSMVSDTHLPNTKAPFAEDNNLTETQQDLLRWLVQEVRAGKLDEEEIWFHWTALDGTSIVNYQGDVPTTKPVTLDALREAGCLICESKTAHEYKLALTRNAYDVVDAISDAGSRPSNIPQVQAHRSNRDWTQYQFKGEVYSKRRLVLAIVSHYLTTHPETTLEELRQIFPDEIHRSFGVVAPRELAQAKGGRQRYFLDEEQLLTAGDGHTIAVCNQWGIGNIGAILKIAERLGYQVDEA